MAVKDRFGDQTREGWLGGGQKYGEDQNRTAYCRYKKATCEQGDCSFCIYDEDEWSVVEDDNKW